MPRNVSLLFLLLLTACESPQDKISRLQHETLLAIGGGDFFEIKTRTRTFKLALPPEPEKAAQRASKISAINQEAYSFDLEGLSAVDRNRVQELNSQLSTLVQHGNGAFFDPNQCLVTETLRQSTDRAVTQELLRKIPEYYAEVARRWQVPSPVRAQKAADASLAVLDLLDEMGEDAIPARLAVKDFIGLCQSAASLQ